MNKKQKDEFLKILDAAIKVAEESDECHERQKSNPSVAPMYYRNKGSLDALKAVREAMQGNSVDLKILAYRA